MLGVERERRKEDEGVGWKILNVVYGPPSLHPPYIHPTYRWILTSSEFKFKMNTHKIFTLFYFFLNLSNSPQTQTPQWSTLQSFVSLLFIFNILSHDKLRQFRCSFSFFFRLLRRPPNLKHPRNHRSHLLQTSFKIFFILFSFFTKKKPREKTTKCFRCVFCGWQLNYFNCSIIIAISKAESSEGKKTEGEAQRCWFCFWGPRCKC